MTESCWSKTETSLSKTCQWQKMTVAIRKIQVDDSELPVTSRKFPKQPMKMAENGKNCQWKMRLPHSYVTSGLARGPLSRCDASLSFHHVSHAFSCIHACLYLPRLYCSWFFVVTSRSESLKCLSLACGCPVVVLCFVCFSFPPFLLSSPRFLRLGRLHIRPLALSLLLSAWLMAKHHLACRRIVHVRVHAVCRENKISVPLCIFLDSLVGSGLASTTQTFLR